MKYQVGDKVRIRSKEWIDAQEKDVYGAITKNRQSFVKEMFTYEGQIAKIVRITSCDNFKIDISPNYIWAEWMFDPDYPDYPKYNPVDEPLLAKDAIRAMLNGETVYNEDKDTCQWVNDEGAFFYFHDNSSRDPVFYFGDLYRCPVEHKRTMTRWEILDWANSDESRGWVVVCSYIKPEPGACWRPPQFHHYDGSMKSYWKARFLPDLSGIDASTIRKFEVDG